MKPRVLITDGIHASAKQILQDVCEPVLEKSLTHDELLACIGDFDALMIRSASKVSEDVLEKGKKLQIVGRAGVGIDNIDVKKATAQGVIVVNSPEGNTVAAAEHTIAMMFALARHIPEADALMKQGQWKRNALTGVELVGKTIGIIGLGKIGARVAKTCLALGMEVNAYDPFLTPAKAAELGVESVSLDTIWEASDFISAHVPKTKDTLHLINKQTLARCRPGVRIVNCARGGVINEAELIEAIKSGHVAGAAIDVFEQEPLPAENPWLELGNKVILTPHLGASTTEAQLNVAIDVAEQIRDYFRDGSARNAVNIPMLRKEMIEPVKDYMPMAEVLGQLAGRLATGAVETVEVISRGSLAQVNAAPLTLAVLKGLFSISNEGVNYVNAKLFAEERAIKVLESSTKQMTSYQNQLKVKLTTTGGECTVSGIQIA
jgi:D-3-phosphoglycerate dehydrogenase